MFDCSLCVFVCSDDPQDAQVAGQYKKDKKAFEAQGAFSFVFGCVVCCVECLHCI